MEAAAWIPHCRAARASLGAVAAPSKPLREEHPSQFTALARGHQPASLFISLAGEGGALPSAAQDNKARALHGVNEHKGPFPQAGPASRTGVGLTAAPCRELAPGRGRAAPLKRAKRGLWENKGLSVRLCAAPAVRDSRRFPTRRVRSVEESRPIWSARAGARVAFSSEEAGVSLHAVGRVFTGLSADPPAVL